jgi:hypothetical protein
MYVLDKFVCTNYSIVEFGVLVEVIIVLFIDDALALTTFCPCLPTIEYSQSGCDARHEKDFASKYGEI